MGVLGQWLCTRSYNGVEFGKPSVCIGEGYISFFKHFWQVVEAVALEGPPIVGPLLYRLIAHTMQDPND
jgi:hypothetical protein